jgi:C-terminal processing protease CtpA/Prc
MLAAEAGGAAAAAAAAAASCECGASRYKVGYVHLSDMDVFGFREFNRHWITESDLAGVIIDLRGYSGGRVSEYD